MAYADAPGLCRHRGQKDFRSGAVGIPFQEMMLYRPDVIEAELVCQPALFQRILVNRKLGRRGEWPRCGQLEENAEFDDPAP